MRIKYKVQVLEAVIFLVTIVGSLIAVKYVEGVMQKILIAVSAILLIVILVLLCNLIRKIELMRLGKKVVGYLDDAILLTNHHNEIVYANEAFLEMVGKY